MEQEKSKNVPHLRYQRLVKINSPAEKSVIIISFARALEFLSCYRNARIIRTFQLRFIILKAFLAIFGTQSRRNVNYRVWVYALIYNHRIKIARSNPSPVSNFLKIQESLFSLSLSFDHVGTAPTLSCGLEATLSKTALSLKLSAANISSASLCICNFNVYDGPSRPFILEIILLQQPFLLHR